MSAKLLDVINSNVTSVTQSYGHIFSRDTCGLQSLTSFCYKFIQFSFTNLFVSC